MATRLTSHFTSLLLLSVSALCAEESNVDKPIDVFGSRLPAKKNTPVPQPASPSNAPGSAPTPTPVPPISHPHTGPLRPYDRLARDNIHVTAYSLENGSTAMARWTSYWSYYQHRTVEQNKLIEISLSGIGNKGGDATVQCYAVIRRYGNNDVAVRCADQDIITDGAGRWCVQLRAVRTELRTYYGDNLGKSGEKLVGFFVRAIRDGRIVGYSASPTAYERFALDTSL